MTLLDLQELDIAEVRALPEDTAVLRRLNAMGIFVGRKLRLVRAAPFAGPLLVEDHASGARMMIARAMARCIEVGYDGP